MKTATVTELKKELEALSPKVMKELVLRLVKYKKENKELLTYLLFEAHDEESYIQDIKAEVDEEFSVVNKASLHWAKKSLRKILRILNKYIKYSGQKQTEVELLLYYCRKLKDSGISFKYSPTLLALYERQLIKAEKALAKLHEDLQYDYAQEIEELKTV